MFSLTTFKGRLDSSVREQETTKTVVASKLGLSSSQTLRNWGYRGSVPFEYIFKLADELNVEARWLLSGLGPRKRISFITAPLIEDWQDCRTWKGRVDDLKQDFVKMFPCPVPSSSLVFTLKIVSDRTAKGFSKGEIAYIDPMIKPCSGDDVLIAFDEQEALSIRRLEVEGEHLYLAPSNSDLPLIEIDSPPCIIYGVVIFVGRSSKANL